MNNKNYSIFELTDKFDLNSIINSKFKKLDNLFLSIDYITLYSSKNSKIFLFLYETNKKTWGIIFQKSLINKIYTNSENKEFYDIESPYGFYGPISNTKDQKFIQEANHIFDKWCIENNIIAEFTRFNPFLNNQNLRVTTNVSIERQNLYYSFNYSNNYSDFNIFNSKLMNQINNYKKYNLKILVSNCDDDYYKFIKIYLNRMKILKASKFYEFDNKFFKNLLNLIKKTGYLLLCKSKEEIIGGTIILFDESNVYYFLSATNRNIKISGISNSLIYHAIQKSIQMKKKIFYLGGGNSKSKDDSLFKFKKKMSNNQIDFFIGKKIFMNEIYDDICQKWSTLNPILAEKYNNYLLKYKLN